MANFTLREQLIEVVNRLFVYTDYREWDKLQQEVFTEKVWFDMSSLGAGEPKEFTAQEICTMWDTGFQGIDAIHHQSGNFIVENTGSRAHVFCYAIASHYKEAATQGKIRKFVGSYDIELVETDKGWKITQFKYTVKYVAGNMELR